MDTYKCKEGSEEFFIDAVSDKEAEESAQMYGGVIIYKLTEKEAKKVKGR
jgi:hypothetical protein